MLCPTQQWYTGHSRVSVEQLARAKAKMQAIVANHLPQTSASISFADSYPPMAPSAGNRSLADELSEVNQASDEVHENLGSLDAVLRIFRLLHLTPTRSPVWARLAKVAIRLLRVLSLTRWHSLSNVRRSYLPSFRKGGSGAIGYCNLLCAEPVLSARFPQRDHKHQLEDPPSHRSSAAWQSCWLQFLESLRRRPSNEAL